jgi:hypothetical protein
MGRGPPTGIAGRESTRGRRCLVVAPKPKEYKYVCQGVLTGGDAAVIFTLLYNDSGKAAAEKAASALEALQFSKGA